MEVRHFPVGEELRYGGEPTRAVLDLPFYGSLPTDTRELTLFRLWLLKKAASDEGLQADLIAMCRHDPLFFINAFCWLYEPRAMHSVIPFNTWPHQDVSFMGLLGCMPDRDALVDKSRSEGASWMCLMIFLWSWLFDESGPTFGLVSRNEDSVDKTDDPDSLMWKLDFQLKWLPPWMRPFFDPRTDRLHSKHVLRNSETGATIVGYAATGDVTTGGRKRAILFDELAKFPQEKAQTALDSTQHVTECRFLVSTHKGVATVYAQMLKDQHRTSALKIVLDWKDNSVKRRGLYKVKRGQVQLLDVDYRHPADYEFVTRPVIGAKIRSPWYDAQCKRPGATPQSIAEELDRDPGGSTFQFFGTVIERVEKRASPPRLMGDFSYDDEECTGHWVSLKPEQRGPFAWWGKLIDGDPENGDYEVGVDISAGTGGDWTSNSVISIFRREDGEQVGEFVSNRISPEDFARLSVAICRWLRGDSGRAHLIWDAHGPPGAQYTNSLVKNTDYRDIYYRKRKLSASIRRKTLEAPGYYGQNKEELLGVLRDCLTRGEVIIRSGACAKELAEYEMLDGKVVHMTSYKTRVERGLAHGDRVMAAALAAMGMGSRPIMKAAKPISRAPIGSIGWRFNQGQEAESEEMEFVW